MSAGVSYSYTLMSCMPSTRTVECTECRLNQIEALERDDPALDVPSILLLGRVQKYCIVSKQCGAELVQESCKGHGRKKPTLVLDGPEP